MSLNKNHYSNVSGIRVKFCKTCGAVVISEKLNKNDECINCVRSHSINEELKEIEKKIDELKAWIGSLETYME